MPLYVHTCIYVCTYRPKTQDPRPKPPPAPGLSLFSSTHPPTRLVSKCICNLYSHPNYKWPMPDMDAYPYLHVHAMKYLCMLVCQGLLGPFIDIYGICGIHTHTSVLYLQLRHAASPNGKDSGYFSRAKTFALLPYNLAVNLCNFPTARLYLDPSLLIFSDGPLRPLELA